MKQILFCLFFAVACSFAPAHADIFIKGDDAYAAKRYRQARQTYLQVARENGATSLSAAARYRAALCLYDLKDFKAFRKEGEVLLKLNEGKHIEKTVFMKHRLAQLPFIQGRWELAVKSLGRFVQEYPRCQYTFDALNNQAKALGKLGRHVEARAVYRDYLQSHSKSPFMERARFKAALCSYALGDYEAFEQEARAVLKQYPTNASEDAEWVKLHLAQAPGRQGRWSESAVQLEALLQTKLRYTRDHARIDCGQAQLKAAEQCLKTDAAKSKALRAQGLTAIQAVRRELEEKLATGKKRANNADVRTMILESLQLEGDWPALAQAAQSLTRKFSPPSLLWAKGMLFLAIAKASQKQPDLNGAAAALDQVIESGAAEDGLAEQLPASALYWRAAVAKARGEKAALKLVTQKLQAMPEGPLKKAALARFSSQANPSQGAQ